MYRSTGRASLMAAIWIFMLSGLLLAGQAFAQSTDPAIENGLTWLQGQIGGTGQLASEAAASALPMQVRSETATTFKALSATPPAALYSAIEGITPDTTEYLARRALARQLAGSSNTPLLAALVQTQNQDGGFGAAAGLQSNPLDTAWALMALAPARTDITLRALMWLAGHQQASGAWLLQPDSDAIVTTALVTQALTPYGDQADAQAALAKSRAWLLAQRNASQTWDDGLRTAHALLALLPGLNSPASVQPAANALRASQRADGSWAGDPYTTALALRALWLVAQPPPSPMNVTLGGVIKDSDGNPLQNVMVAAGAASTFTGATGAYQITGINPGAATVTASLSGYQTVAANITFVAGSSYLFSPTLYATGVTPPATSLQGIVVNKAGAVISGASVVLGGGATVVTDTNGKFIFTNQTAGAFTLTISAAGYASITVTGSLVAGANDIGKIALTTQVQTITCTTDPASVFNTGTNGSGGILAGGASDLNWQVSNPGLANSAFSAGDYSAVPDSNWVPAVVMSVPTFWRQNVSDAAWISQTFSSLQSPSVSADIFYRLQFTLDSSVNLAAFQLNMDFWADNSVYEVWVNGMPQSGLPGVGTLPQTPADPYWAFNYVPSATLTTYTFSQGWQMGLNTLIVDIKTAAGLVGLLAQFRGNQTCQPFSAIQMDVATDQPAYPANATALVTTTLTNPNAHPISGTLTVDVVDADGALVSNVTQQGVSIPAGGNLPVSGPFSIGTILPAQYTVVAMLANNGGVEMAHASTTFNVLPDNPSASTTSTVTTDRYTYNPSDRVTINSRVQSQSVNLVLSNLTLAVQVVDAGGAVRFTHGHAIAQLPPGAMLDLSVQQSLVNAPAGVYTVKQDLQGEDKHVLHHAETTYRVGSTRNTGFGLTGTLAATPHAVHEGEMLTLAAAATNQGNADLADLPLTLSLIDPGLGSVVAQFTQTSTVATSASVPFNTTWTAQGKAGATYWAVLTAQIDSGTSVALAQDSFQIVAGPVVTTPPVPVPIDARWLLLCALCMLLLGYRAARTQTTQATGEDQ